MASTAPQPETPGALSPKSDIAVIGAGIAGLTCALRLSQRGYRVTLYEKDKMLGGNLSSVLHKELYHDVYTHLFCDWYVNFWSILENDLKIGRDEAFEPRLGVKLLDLINGQQQRTGKAPGYVDLKNPTSLKNILENLKSGALPPPDMFLVGFTMLDLASQPFRRSVTLEQQTVNGFLYSRPYATQDCADLHNTILNEIWSISSNDTSAAAYKDFIKHSLGSSAPPFAWLLRGSLEERLIAPWKERLGPNCLIKSGVAVTGLEIGDDNKVHLTLGDHAKVTHDNAVLAVPAPELAKLVVTGGGKPGDTTRCVVERLPQLSELQRLRTANILVVTVVFKERLKDIPPEHVGLSGSRGYLTFIDISQLWTNLNGKEQPTVLILAASDANDYPASRDEEWAHLMLEEFARYLPVVKPGSHWGDPHSNIDYCNSFAQNNRNHTLFLNDMNSEHLVVEPAYAELPSVFFAGDFCLNEVKMATVEAAVLSGLHAARAVQTRVEGKTDIVIEQSVMPSSGEFAAAKLLLLPLAYGAMAWSAVNAAMRDLSDGRVDTPEEILTPGTTLALLPLRFAADWVKSLENLAIAVFSSTGEPGSLGAAAQEGLRAAAKGVLAASPHLTSDKSSKPRDLSSLLTDIFRAINAGASEASTARARTGQASPSAPPSTGGLLRGSGRYRPRSNYVRRHRAKP
ncbi:FAD-dependent oxidoreductase [Bradyrhizobium sp. WSM 1704]|uniref:FAD-dependent oxidoreductase n=1 Tax=Bradyrhizobium semiaridum TaxID=2821404 RepID=UPI001CE3733F|nr:FAD-dependent oxidoreductase [Bradyrhizobium semiaridum]MCA6121350.1 FAD-dependent oxidoreductase [Bradyrhizobium semiaridum]